LKVSQPVATAPAVAAAATSGWKTVGLNKVPQPIPVARTLTATPAAVAPLRKSPVLTTARPANAIKPSTHSPSLDFLKWLKESLKGLNAGVNGKAIALSSPGSLTFV
jgi:PERQ amino acid-rich with GYF domain-containing protein